MLSWTPPASNGGSPITGYTATASPGGPTCTTTGTNCTFTGLTNGTTYSFTVKATNAVGTGPASNSLLAIPATVPGAPTLTSANAGSGSVTLAWSAPSSNGGSTVTGYTATPSPGGFTCTTSGATGCTVTGLTNGTSYSFTVRATNALGTGPASNALSATPVAAATVPGAPSLVSAVRGNGQVTLTWSAPFSDGGTPVTGYVATASPGGFSCTTSGLSCTVTGLTNGTTYSFTVTATNAVGTGGASTRSPPPPATAARRADAQHGHRGQRRRSRSAGRARLERRLRDHRLHRHRKPRRRSPAAALRRAAPSRGLTNGTSYSFTVTATNAVGTGAASNALSRRPATVSRRADPDLSAVAATARSRSTWIGPGLERRLGDHRLHRHLQPRRLHVHHDRRARLHRHRPHQRHAATPSPSPPPTRRHRRPLERASATPAPRRPCPARRR